MAKLRKGNASSHGKQKTRLWQGIFALIVLAGVVSAYVLRDRESSSGADKASTNENLPDLLSTSPMLRDRLVLPARPQNPRPVTLDPKSFSDPEVREAYQAAKDLPEVLEHIACYCGCFGTAGHRNNLDCYHDNHGVT